MRPWLAIAGLSVLATLGSPTGFEAARDAVLTEPWRLWLGPLHHADAGHLMRDLVGLSGLAVIVGRRLAPGRTVALIALGLPLPAIAALIGDPGATGYYGVSGLVHALCVVALVDLGRSRPAWAVGLGLALAAKLVFELATGGHLVALDGGRPAAWGHAAGALVGWVVAAPVARYRPKSSRRQATHRLTSEIRIS